MTPTEAIIGRINKGPATIADLACEVHVQCSAETCDMYRIAYSEVLALIVQKRIHRHESGAFMLPPSTPVEEVSKDPKSTLRPGTVIPKKYRHLSISNPRMPHTGKE